MSRIAIVSVLAVVCVVRSSRVGVAANADSPKEKGGTVTNAVLQERDLPGLKLRRVHPRRWVTALDPQRRPLGTDGLEQEWEIGGVRAMVHYAEFPTNDEAHQAAEYVTRNVAAVLEKGIWSGAHHKAIGDESWFSRDAGNAALLVRSARVCILVGCIEGDADKQTHAAEALAKRIVDKVSSGGRVIIPKEESPKEKAPE